MWLCLCSKYCNCYFCSFLIGRLCGKRVPTHTTRQKSDHGLLPCEEMEMKMVHVLHVFPMFFTFEEFGEFGEFVKLFVLLYRFEDYDL